MQPLSDFKSPSTAIRSMQAGDVGRCIWIRTQTRENCWSLEALHEVGITEESVARKLAATHEGWVCECEGQIVGFSISDKSTGEFWVVAVLPQYEGRGIGTKLIQRGQQWLHEQGWPEIWLWTSPDTSKRAYKLYRKLGWQDCGVKKGQLILRHHE